RAERYQSAKDVLEDLKELKQWLTLRGSSSPTLQSSSPTLQIGVALPTLSTEYLISQIKRHRLSLVLSLGALLIMAASIFYFPRRQAIESVAVVPFINANGDPNTEYLSEGISESINYSLARLPNLKVMASSS